MKRLFNLLLSGCALGSTLTLAADGDITTLAELNRSGSVQQAYQLASRMLVDWEADPQFDREYATAALAAGKASEAIFALERLLSFEPNDTGVQAELARAYALLSSQPLLPGAVLSSTASAQLKAGFNGSVAIGGGYGENLDAGPDDKIMWTPSGILRAPWLQQRDDAFTSLRAGLRYRFPLGERWQGFADARMAGRWHRRADDLDSLTASLRVGGVRETDSGRLELAVQGQQYQLDDHRWLDYQALSVDYLHVINSDLTLGPFISLSRQDHSLAELDSHLLLVGAKANWRIQHPLGPLLYGGFYAGREKPREHTANSAGRADRALQAGFIGLRLEPNDKLWVNAEGVLVNSRYEGPFQLWVPVTGNSRRDDLLELKLELGWRFDQRWSTQVGYVYHDNDSNTRLLQYQRQQTELTLRYEF